MSNPCARLRSWLGYLPSPAELLNDQAKYPIVGGMAVLPDKVSGQGIPLPILWLIGKWKFGAYLPTGRMYWAQIKQGTPLTWTFQSAYRRRSLHQRKVEGQDQRDRLELCRLSDIGVLS